MFISKKRLQDREKMWQENCDYWQHEYNKVIGAQIPFPALCVERLERWKERHDDMRKPEKHKIEICLIDNRIKWIKHNDWEEICKIYLEVRENKKKEVSFYITSEESVMYDKVVSINLLKGHPDPYTPEEIESWAKEQLEKEMQEWKVVKEEPRSATEIVIRQRAAEDAEAAKNAMILLNYYQNNPMIKCWWGE